MAIGVSILLVVPEQMIREALRDFLNATGQLEIVAEAAHADQVIDLVGERTPTMVLLDVGELDMACLAATRKMQESHPDLRILAISSTATRPRVMQILEAGAAGYVLKSASSSELLRAIEAVSDGDSYLSPEVASIVVENSLRRTDRSPPASELSPREREVLQYLADGLTSPQIADKLHLSASTIDTHRKNIMRKLGIRSIAELTKYAIRVGLTSLD